MLAAFLAGAAAYPMLELAWRGRTHPAMALAGGVSLAVLRGVSRMQKGRPLWQQALLGGLMITGVEYAFGLISTAGTRSGTTGACRRTFADRSACPSRWPGAG